MSDCVDPKIGDMLYAYELGMLAEEERDIFEQHLISCESCSRRVTENIEAARLIRSDRRLREYTKSLAGDNSLAATVPSVKSRSWTRWAISVPVAAAVLLFLVLTDWHFDIRPHNQAVARENRLIVLYFTDLTDTLDQNSLSAIATNLLITDLGESPHVLVVSSERILALANSLGYSKEDTHRPEVAAEIARETGAAWILTGEILRADSRLVVTSQLSSAASGDILATQRVDGAPGIDIFTVVDSLGAKIRRDLPWSVPAEPETRVADITTHSAEAYRHYLQGIELATRFQTDEAISEFELALQHDSTFAMAYYRLSRLGNAGAIRRALDFSSSVSRKERYYIESQFYLENGDTARAIDLLHDLIKAYPEESLAYRTLAYVYRITGDTTEAGIRYLEAALQIDPYDRDAYNALVYAYYATGDREKAFLAANRYIDIAPDEPNPYDTRGDLLLHDRSFDAALESYLRALEIKPDNYTSLFKCGHLYLRKQDFSRADSCYTVCATAGDQDERARARVYQACVAILQGQFTRSLELLESGVAADMADSEFAYAALKLRMKGRVLATEGRFDEAIQTVRRCESMDEPLGDAGTLNRYTDLVNIWIAAGRLDSAEAGLAFVGDHYLSADSSLWNYWYLKAAIEFSRDDPRAAAASLARIDAYSLDFPARYLMGRVALENGELSRAIDLLQGIRDDIGPNRFLYGIDFLRSQYHLGQAYEASRWTDRAVEQYEYFLSWWDKANTQLPEIAEARRRLARLRSGS